jgi:hypothetical protein
MKLADSNIKEQATWKKKKAFIQAVHSLDKATKLQRRSSEGQVIKGIWRMPRRQETMKDVVSCEKLRGDASSQ